MSVGDAQIAGAENRAELEILDGRCGQQRPGSDVYVHKPEHSQEAEQMWDHYVSVCTSKCVFFCVHSMVCSFTCVCVCLIIAVCAHVTPHFDKSSHMLI